MNKSLTRRSIRYCVHRLAGLTIVNKPTNGVVVRSMHRS